MTMLLVIGGFNVFISVYWSRSGGPADQTQVLLTYMYQQAFSYLDFGYGSAHRVHPDAARVRARRWSSCGCSAGPVGMTSHDGHRQSAPARTRSVTGRLDPSWRSARSCMMIPFAYMLSTSFKSRSRRARDPAAVHPAPPDNRELHRPPGRPTDFGRYFLNSVLVAVATTFAARCCSAR